MEQAVCRWADPPLARESFCACFASDCRGLSSAVHSRITQSTDAFTPATAAIDCFSSSYRSKICGSDGGDGSSARYRSSSSPCTRSISVDAPEKVPFLKAAIDLVQQRACRTDKRGQTLKQNRSISCDTFNALTLRLPCSQILGYLRLPSLLAGLSLVVLGFPSQARTRAQDNCRRKQYPCYGGLTVLEGRIRADGRRQCDQPRPGRQSSHSQDRCRHFSFCGCAPRPPPSL